MHTLKKRTFIHFFSPYFLKNNLADSFFFFFTQLHVARAKYQTAEGNSNHIRITSTLPMSQVAWGPQRTLTNGDHSVSGSASASSRGPDIGFFGDFFFWTTWESWRFARHVTKHLSRPVCCQTIKAHYSSYRKCIIHHWCTLSNDKE